mmetsp:Transcript_84745/g.237250  ORF Transcript_84745/g.237250 Transcript_84745/m.237250 type:complete len:512 (+) Transcript_84745:78-1613(+)
MKAPKRVRNRANSDGWYSGKTMPKVTIVGQGLLKRAVKAGSMVLEIGGHFRRVSLKHRVSFEAAPGTFNRPDGRAAGERYEKYRSAKTLGEAVRLGASQDDLVFHTRRGFLHWVPELRAPKVTQPLPRSEWPPGIRACDRLRPFWLPEDWAQGVKTTCKTFLPVYIAPNGKTYYHRTIIEQIVSRQLGGLEGMRKHALRMVSEGKDWAEEKVSFGPDAKLFACLSKQERACLPGKDELHFCVVSARRAGERTGIRGLVNVQSKLLAAGVRPRWYVDEASLQEYRALGLDAVVGGRLTAARNKALNDAARKGKACVQLSDDINRWSYFSGSFHNMREACRGDASRMLKRANEAARSSDMLTISPVAAARFLLAKMRAAEGRPRLGGIYPTGNAALGLLTGAPVSRDGFILGDFFVHDGSPCRFDESMTLKEDYDFTCSHLARHGCVLRVNRLILQATHESNPGGAVAERDSKGMKERQNIKILMRKWPGVFKLHGTRGDTQVTMRWSRRQIE